MPPKSNKLSYKPFPKLLNQPNNRKISYNSSNPSNLSIAPLINPKSEAKQLSPLSYNSSPKGTKSPIKPHEESFKDLNSSENEVLSIKNIENGEKSNSKKKEKKSFLEFKMIDLQHTSVKNDENTIEIQNKPQIKVTYSQRTSFSSKKGGRSPISVSPRYQNNNGIQALRRRSLALNNQQTPCFRVNTQPIK